NNNTVGGTVAGSGNAASLVNVISGNTGDGVSVSSSNSTTIINSYIGTDATGSNVNSSLGNQNGIRINNSNGTQLGFFWSTGSGNVISGNVHDGVLITGSSAGTDLRSNFIGTDATGLITSARLGNQGYGVHLQPVTGTTTIGGAAAGSSNVISGNRL